SNALNAIAAFFWRHCDGKLRSSANGPWGLGLVIFIVAVLGYILQGNLQGNELDTLVMASALHNPEFMPGDWGQSRSPGMRLPFCLLVRPLVATLSLLTVSVVGRLLAYAFVAAGLGRLAFRLKLSPSKLLFLLGIYLTFGQMIAAGEWMFGALEGKVVA